MGERLAPCVSPTPYCIITHSAEVITSPFSFAQKLQRMPWVFIMVLTSFFWFPREVCVCVCVLSCLVVSDSVIPWTVACQAPLSIEFSRQEYWSGLPFPIPGDPPDPGTESASPVFSGRFFMAEPPEKSLCCCCASVYTSNHGSLDWWIHVATVTSMDSGARLPGFDSWFSPSEVVTSGKSLNLVAH